MKNNSGKNVSGKGIFVMVVLALLVLATFYIINNRARRIEKDVEKVSPVKELLVMDLSTNYPNTPKEVVKLYSEITRCFYGESYSEEEFLALAKMSRQLFDQELVDNQDEESYIRALRAEVALYKQKNSTISSVSISSSADVEYYNFKDDEWAQLIAIYSIKTGNSTSPTKDRFLLRKDDDGHWKIFGFRNESMNTSGNGEQ